MTSVPRAIDQIATAQKVSNKPLAIVLAGHNGSGKSTFWRDQLAGTFQMPLVNADRMMLAILPEPPLPEWAALLRDRNESWMKIAQKGVEAFVAQAMAHHAPFAMETVFSYWHERDDGQVDSKIQLIEQMQSAGYFVVLVFVGLMSADLSVLRVATRVASGGHDVPMSRLQARFPRTQRAIGRALHVADGVLLTDNSRAESHAFSVCHVRVSDRELFDLRDAGGAIPREIGTWLDVVVPR